MSDSLVGQLLQEIVTIISAVLGVLLLSVSYKRLMHSRSGEAAFDADAPSG
ncbi:hypothetical protein [Arhodomonas sp. AD133]|uniref:hypothetical protein n=1 Tax=Arhodomonas sp. AD133 TaxID=3415009 RepID=UPI003EBF0997